LSDSDPKRRGAGSNYVFFNLIKDATKKKMLELGFPKWWLWVIKYDNKEYDDDDNRATCKMGQWLCGRYCR